MNPFTRYLPALEAELRAALAPAPHSPSLLYGMLHYHLGWVDAAFQPAQLHAGKRLRPIFLLLACEAQGGDWRQALPAATAIELLHNFSLIHDDIEDGDRTRRGRPTLWALWGEAQAINAGDALFALAFRTLTRLQDTGIPPAHVLTAQRHYLNTTLHLTEGQCRDIAFETAAEVDEVTYLRMVGGKTAVLIGLCAQLGGLIAAAPEERVTALWEFGHNLGLSFQMQDDLLGLWGDPERTGKPVGADLRQHKKTLPILHGLAHSPELRALLEAPTLDEATIAHAQALLQAVGSQAYTEQLAETYHRRARDAFARTGGRGPAHDALAALVQNLLHRDH